MACKWRAERSWQGAAGDVPQDDRAVGNSSSKPAAIWGECCRIDLVMRASVNGHEYSRASLAEIHWSFGEMLAYASRGTEVVPGDVIGSGTCGTGCILELSLVHGEDRYPWLKPGDRVELEVEHLGRMIGRVIEGRPLRPLRPER